MLTIRFNRVGKKNKAQFRIVVQEHTIAPGGRHVDIVGSWDPHSKKGTFKEDRIKHWIKEGAQVSDSVHNLLVKQEIISGEKRSIKIRDKKKEKADAEKSEEGKEKTDESKEDKSTPTEATEDKKEEVAAKTEEDKKEETPAAEEKSNKPEDKKPADAEAKEEKPAEDKPKEDK